MSTTGYPLMVLFVAPNCEGRLSHYLLCGTNCATVGHGTHHTNMRELYGFVPIRSGLPSTPLKHVREGDYFTPRPVS